jgi:hypothetical protein
MISLWTANNILRPQTIRARGVRSPTTLVILAQVASFPQVTIRAGWKVKRANITAEAGIFFAHPNFIQKLFVHISQRVLLNIL